MAQFDLDSSDGLQKLAGDTDGTGIGNVGDRLKVDALVTNAGAPGSIVHHESISFLNGASDVMAVDGSVTPVVFSIAPPSGQIWYIDTLSFLFSDGGASKSDDWGAINGGLTNGVLIETFISSVSRTIANLKINRGLVITFSDGAFSGGNSGFITDANFYSGILDMRPNVTLIGSAGDKIKVTVRDNLTGLISQQMSAHYWREI